MQSLKKCIILIGLFGFSAACTPATEPSFAARNAQVDLGLQSLVRLQSNELLATMQRLETSLQSKHAAPRKLGRILEDSVAQMDQIQMNLPSLLAAQDVEIADLRSGHNDGHIDKAVMSSRASQIDAYRKGLIGSLKSSGARAKLAKEALKASPHAQRAANLSRDLKDARTMIEMQL